MIDDPHPATAPDSPEEEGDGGAYGPQLTPETALADLAGTDAETLLLPSSSRALYFFAYDHLMDQGVVSRYVKKLVPAKIARAPHYKLVWPYYYPPQGTSLPSLQRSGSGEVWGLLYDAKGCDFSRLEQALNCPNRYHRRALNVLDRGERRFTAFTYVLTAFDDSARPPSAAYLNELVAAATDRGLPEEWILTLSALPWQE